MIDVLKGLQSQKYTKYLGTDMNVSFNIILENKAHSKTLIIMNHPTDSSLIIVNIEGDNYIFINNNLVTDAINEYIEFRSHTAKDLIRYAGGIRVKKDGGQYEPI